MSCQVMYAAENKDSLRFEQIKETIIYEKILNSAVDDPATIKANVKCIKPGCGSDTVKQVVVGDDMKLFNICIKCRTKWLN